MDDLDFGFALENTPYGRYGRSNRLFEAYREWNENSDDAKALREAAHTTSDFATYLSAVIRKRFYDVFAAAPTNWRQYTRQVDVPDFKPETLVGLGQFSPLQRVDEEGEYTYGTLGEIVGPQVAVHTYGRLMQIHRYVFINDDLGKIRTIPQAMALSAGLTLLTDVMNVLVNNPNTYDGYPLFDSAHHGNLGTDALDEDSLEAGLMAIQKQTNQNGRRAMFKATDLVVPVDLQFAAARILNSTLLGVVDGTGTTNVLKGIVNLIVEPYLLDPNDWYLQGAIPGDDPALIVVSFLNGNDTPDLLQRTTVQQMGGGAYDPYKLEVDSVDWKVRHDWGVTPGEWRAGYKAAVA